MHNVRSSLLFASAIPALLLPSSLYAQTASGDSTVAPKDIIVTAEKKSEKLSEVPMGVTALTGADLTKLQQRSFADYASSVPGLSVTSSSPGSNRLTLRGLNAGGVGSTVAVYVDDSPFGSSTALLNGGLLSANFDTWDLARVEVLAGPQGTFYGANSEGGLIKFVTNAPDTSAFGVAGEVADQGVDGGGNGVALRGMLNVPLSDKVAIRVSGYRETYPGYIDDPLLGEKDVNGGHKLGGRASILIKPADNLSIRLTAFGQSLKIGGTNAVDVDPATLKPIYGDLVQKRYLPENYSFSYQNYNGTINWDLGGASITSTTSYSVQKINQPIDYTSYDVAGTITYGDYLSDYLFGKPLSMGLSQHLNLKKFTQEVRLASSPSDRFEWQLGGYYTRENALLSQVFTAYDLGTTNAASGVPNLETLTIDSHYTEYAGFANGTLKFGPHFDIQAGGRYSHNQQDALEQGNGYFFNYSGISYTGNSSQNVFTYSVAPRFKVNPHLMIYGRVASGFRPGGPNVLPPMSDSNVPLQYGADRTTNYEIGVRADTLSGRLSLQLTTFDVQWKDIQLLEVIDSTGVNGNGGKARTRGLEWNVVALPVKNLTLRFVGAYTDAKLTSSTPSSQLAGANTGDPLPFAPRWSQSIDGEYDFPIGDTLKAYVGGKWSYTGKRYGNFSGTVPQTELSSYDTVDLRAGISFGRYDAQLFVKNATNSRGIASYSSTVTSPDQSASLSITRPRTIGASLSFHM